MESDSKRKKGHNNNMNMDRVYFDFLKNPFCDWLIDLCPEITKCPNEIKDFINSCHVEFCDISSLEEVDELAEAFRNEHNSREYGLEDGYLEDVVENALVDEYKFNLGKRRFEEELPVISGGVLLKAGYQNPLTNDYAFEHAGFASVLESESGIELSAIYLASEFRGKELEGKRCSELLLGDTIKYVENQYPQRMFFAYVEKGNVFPLSLLRKFGFKRGLTDRLGYDMYIRD